MKNLLLALTFISICSITNAQKMVLFEKFTNAFCGVCPDATLNLIDLVEENPNAIWISHHKPVSWTDNPLTNEKSIAIWDDLGVSGVPQGMVDRTIYNNSITMSRSLWKARVESHLQQSSPFEVEINEVNFDVKTRILTFNVSADVIAEATNDSYRITAYIVEDSVNNMEQHSYWNDVPGHPLEGRGDIIWDYYHRNVVRTILDDHWGIPNIIPAQPIVGELYSHTFTYTIPDEYKPERIKLVAMVAQFDEVNNYPGEVQNAAQIKLKDTGVKLTDTKEIPTSLISIFPNPARDYLNVTFEEMPDNIQIFDLSGQLKLNIKPTHLSTIIELQILLNGTYYLVAETKGKLNGQVFSVMK